MICKVNRGKFILYWLYYNMFKLILGKNNFFFDY